jgi:hypothetical protein
VRQTTNVGRSTPFKKVKNMPNSHESDLAALQRLIKIARSDTGQSSRVANFLLAWWNAGRLGGFDLTELWMLDRAIVADMARVFQLIADSHSYPDSFGFEKDIHAIISDWRHSTKNQQTIRSAVELVEDAGLSARIARNTSSDGLILHVENRARFPAEHVFDLTIREDGTINAGKLYIAKKISAFFAINQT